MSVIQFPKAEDTRLSDVLSRAGEQLTSETPPDWVRLQLRAHSARQATVKIPVPVAVGALQPSVAGAGVGGDFGTNQLIDLKAWGIALLVLIGLIALLAGAGSTRLNTESDASPTAQLTKSQSATEDDFVPVASSQRWKQIVPRTSSPTSETGIDSETGARAWVVAAEVPAAQLARFGLPFDPSRAGEPVRAELLLHSSGEILAVRLER